jgi:hypothetical protein
MWWLFFLAGAKGMKRKKETEDLKKIFWERRKKQNKVFNWENFRNKT